MSDLSVLRRYELRLLSCTISPSRPNSSPSDQPSPPHPLSSLIFSFLTSIESGRYLDVLTSTDADCLIFKFSKSDSLHGPDRVYSELLRRVESFLRDKEENDIGKDKTYRVVMVLCIAVAVLLALRRKRKNY